MCDKDFVDGRIRTAFKDLSARASGQGDKQLADIAERVSSQRWALGEGASTEPALGPGDMVDIDGMVQTVIGVRRGWAWTDLSPEIYDAARCLSNRARVADIAAGDDLRHETLGVCRMTGTDPFGRPEVQYIEDGVLESGPVNRSKLVRLTAPDHP